MDNNKIDELRAQCAWCVSEFECTLQPRNCDKCGKLDLPCNMYCHEEAVLCLDCHEKEVKHDQE